MKTRTFVTASTIIFLLVLLGHLIRLTEEWPVRVGSFSLPLWGSILAALVSAGLVLWGVLLLRRHP